MSDVLYLALTTLFFVVAFLVLRGGPAVSVENLVGLIVSLLILGYLLVALLFPERF